VEPARAARPARGGARLIPPLVAHLGADRFGVVTLAWALVGYFTLFDFGIGPAVTRTLARCRAEGRESEAPAGSGPRSHSRSGSASSGRSRWRPAAPWLTHSLLKVPAELQGETLGILSLLALSLPFVTVSAAAGGALAAYQRFGALNAVRIPLGALTFLAPLAVSLYTTNLAAVGAALALTRFFGAAANLALCVRLLPGVGRRMVVRRDAVGPLLGFGGWMTVSAVVGPFMVYFDRFLIGSLLSLAMVAYYTTPYDLATRIWILSQAIVGVLFPAMTGDFARDPASVRRLFAWGVRLVATLVFPVTFLLVLFAPEGMTLWLGETFAAHGAPVLRWVAAGVFLNCLAQIALAVVQASGRPRWSATLHTIELPFYLAVLVLLVRWHGIEGAAQAWFLRVVVDTVALFLMARRRVEGGDAAAIASLARCCRAGRDGARRGDWRRPARARCTARPCSWCSRGRAIAGSTCPGSRCSQRSCRGARRRDHEHAHAQVRPGPAHGIKARVPVCGSPGPNSTAAFTIT
jgi:O-antigen/teichoic acid export membrane protein